MNSPRSNQRGHHDRSDPRYDRARVPGALQPKLRVARPPEECQVARSEQQHTPQPSNLSRTIVPAVGAGVAYYVGAQIGFAFTLGTIPTSIFWLPNSIMFAVLLLAPPRRWWVYVLAALPAHLAVQL